MVDEQDEYDAKDATVQVSSDELQILRESGQQFVDLKDETIQVSSDDLRELRESAQLLAFESSALQAMEDDSTKSITRESLVDMLKEEVAQEGELPQSFGILKHAKLGQASVDALVEPDDDHTYVVTEHNVYLAQHTIPVAKGFVGSEVSDSVGYEYEPDDDETRVLQRVSMETLADSPRVIDVLEPLTHTSEVAEENSFSEPLVFNEESYELTHDASDVISAQDIREAMVLAEASSSSTEEPLEEPLEEPEHVHVVQDATESVVHTHADSPTQIQSIELSRSNFLFWAFIVFIILGTVAVALYVLLPPVVG